jgi:hypothetical protein
VAALTTRPHMYSLNHSINMISLFLGTNQLAQLALHLLKNHVPLPPLFPLKMLPGSRTSRNSSTLLAALQRASSICHRFQTTTCNATIAVSLSPYQARSGNTRGTTSSHGNAITQTAPRPSHCQKIWNATRVPCIEKETNHTTTAIATLANTVAVGQQMGSHAKTTGNGIWQNALNEFENINDHILLID